MLKRKDFKNTRCDEVRQKPRDTSQYTFYTTCHPLGAKKGFVKGGTLRLPWTTFSKINLKRTLNSSKYT